MAERAIHCPFLNRSDARCSSHFSLDHLSDAFEQCMDAYQSCPVYLELLAERRQRRGQAALAMRGGHPGTHQQASTFDRPPEFSTNRSDAKTAVRNVTIVPLTLAGGRTAYSTASPNTGARPA